MTNRNVCRALAAAWLTFGVTAVAPAVAQAQDVSSLPKGHVTLWGCFVRMIDPNDTDDERYMLANPTLGQATTVDNQNCTASPSDPILRLTDVDDSGLIPSVSLGRWVEISGELGRMRDSDDLRKFEVGYFREVPLTPPTVAILIPIPVPRAETPKVAEETPQPEPEGHVETPTSPVATSGIEPVKKLPKTASPLPLIGMLGLFAVTGGVVLRLFERRRALGRE